MTLRRTVATVVTALALSGLAACGSDEADDTATAAPTAEPTETADEQPAAASGDQPAWAKPLTDPGEKIATITLGDVTVDAYQVGVTQATKTGQFVDPDDNEPIIDEGDDIVFVNYVITNSGDPVDLGSSLVSIDARYDDWPYLQGMDGVVDDALYEEQGVNTDGLAPGGLADPPIYTLGTGESYSFAENFRYQKGSGITFEATITPVDADGELVFDDQLEGEGSGTIS